MNDRSEVNALTMRVVDLEQWRRRVDSALAVPRCPAWCTETGMNHRTEYDSEAPDDSGVLMRIHGANFGHVAVMQTEVNRHGRVSYEAPYVVIESESIGIEQTRQLARDLGSAAELLERISSGGAQ